MAELLDIYDEKRLRTGTVIERGAYILKENEFLLYVLAILRNHDGRFLITRRSMKKTWGAGWWEITGGAVLAGESPLEAVRREVGEELGLDVSRLDPVLLYTYQNIDPPDNYFVDIFRFDVDVDPKTIRLQEGETVDCALVTWDDIVELNEAGRFLHFERLQSALNAYESVQ